MKISSVVAFLAVSSASAFAPVSNNKPSTALNAEKNVFSKFAAASVASAILLSSTVATPDALAADMTSVDFGSTDIIAARSGGRAGGRSTASSMRSPAPAARTQTTTINRTTVVAAPPVYSAPSVIIAPAPVFSPFGGMGYGALGAVSAIGNEMRDIRQENEIARERAELEVSKQRQYQLEQRLAQLESQQAQTNANANMAASMAAAAASK
ncbi:hypothetical protein CTEN210_17212 [Chaetoceros tenuissimus]|uniref:Uncharacterized protein n=1 Tax=Chaetoceros tenuissimus TaxID=426638 RepID=A0AAD3HEV1_9STRA|nr:hypothetical protein CTEN210_17212 [Chaetoceros tenuissimus]